MISVGTASVSKKVAEEKKSATIITQTTAKSQGLSVRAEYHAGTAKPYANSTDWHSQITDDDVWMRTNEGDGWADCVRIKGEDGKPTSMSIMLWSEVKDEDHTFYSAQSVGDINIADVVIDDTDGQTIHGRYVCIETYDYYADDDGDLAPHEDPEHWLLMTTFENVATNLLLSEAVQTKILYAVKAHIDQLSVGRLSAMSGNNIVATVNESGDGSFIQYYATGERKMVISDGVITYYDRDGSVKWTLGAEGNIEKSVQYYENISLCKFSSLDACKTTDNITGTTYYILHHTGSADDGKYYKTKSPAVIVDDGYYTYPGLPMQKPTSPSSVGITYVRNVLYIVDGKVSGVPQIAEWTEL